MSGERFRFEKNFIDAGKTLLANVAPQVIGFFDANTKTNARIEVGFALEENAGDGSRWLNNSNATLYRSDYSGDWEIAIVTRYTDTNHHAYVGDVREVFGSRWTAIQGNTNGNYEVQSVHEVTPAEFTRDEESDEMTTRLRFRAVFSVKPW
jgi:hypothetical protein